MVFSWTLTTTGVAPSVAGTVPDIKWLLLHSQKKIDIDRDNKVSQLINTTTKRS